MKNRILITGGAGFIGSALCLKLLDAGYEVTAFDNLSPQVHGNNPERDSYTYLLIKDKVRFILGDVRNRVDLEFALKGQSILVHLAAETGTGQSMYEIAKYSDVNILGTAQLLDILTNSKQTIEKVIVASSRAVYGEGKYICSIHGDVYPLERKEADMKKGDFECKCPKCGSNIEVTATDEESKLHPTSIYGITKQNQEQMVLNVCKSLGLSAMALRFQNVYGPGQSLTNPYTGILSIFSSLIHQNEPIQIFEDGKESRDFVYINDVIEATYLSIINNDLIQEAFNVGSGNQISVKKIALELMKSYYLETELKITGHYRIGDIRHNYSDNSKIKNMLGYTSQFDFNKGVSYFIDWVNKQETKQNNFNHSMNELIARGFLKNN
jgi:dTDP-L-rhamnose 4-epimerase